MGITIEAKIQWFGDQINTRICALEDNLIRDYDSISEDEELLMRNKIEALEEIYDVFEDVFEDNLYKDEE